MTALLHLHLFQRFDVVHAAQGAVDLTTQRAQELLCYLLVHRGRAHHREALADHLWADGAAAGSKKNLRHVLWQVNRFLAQAAGCDMDILHVDKEWIQVNRDAAFWLDLAEFEAAYQGAKGVQGQALSPAQAKRLDAAVALYRGQLLEGWYQVWCLTERARLHNIYLLMLDKLLRHAEARQDYEAGIHYGALALRSDPARESTHRRLMRLHLQAGHRSAALEQYERCVAALRDELDVAPDQTTQALHAAIRGGRANHAGAGLPSVHLLRQVGELQATIDALQAQLDGLRGLIGPTGDARQYVDVDAGEDAAPLH